MRAIAALTGLGLLGLTTTACVPHQWVPVRVHPSNAAVYLDGKPLESDIEEVKLRSDRDHTVLVKSPGHRGELVILRSVEREGDPMLEPDGVWVRLAPEAGLGRDLVIEPEPDFGS